MSTQRKDKKKVLNEEFSNEMLKGFLDLTPADNSNPDFHILLKAYRGMPAPVLERFLIMFKQAQRDINATNNSGQTLLSIVKQHANSSDYVAILKKAGAN